MTLAESVLRLVQHGPRLLQPYSEPSPYPAETRDSYGRDADPDLAAGGLAGADPAVASQAIVAEDVQLPEHLPGFEDLEAAVSLVTSGLARRVVLTGFPSWPGLLWRAYRLADASEVVILPTVVRPGGRVDVVIERDSGADV